MFNIKIISILTIFVFLFVGCEDPTKPKESNSATKKNTLNDSDLGFEEGWIEDYFYNFDEEIDANYLYYNSYITGSSNTINSPSGLNPYLDTLNFHTFPFYTVEIENQLDLDTVSYLLSLTPENIDNYSTLYPLDETNTGASNWCDNVLVEYEGDCPDSVEVSFDSQFATTGTGALFEDMLYSPASYSGIISKKEVTFTEAWTDIDSIFWSNELDRYDVVGQDVSNVIRATLCTGICDSARTDTIWDDCSDDYEAEKFTDLNNDGTFQQWIDEFDDVNDDADKDGEWTGCYDSTFIIKNISEENISDSFDSLIYVGVIDTNRVSIDSVMLVDRSEWERYDIIYKSDDKNLKLDTTFSFEKVIVPDDSPMYRVNGDCNQNLQWDDAERYFDFGPDMCPDSLETGADIYTDVNENGSWDESEPLIIDWNNDGSWTKAFCEVRYLDSDSADEKPCNCLGDWRETIGGIANPNWEGPVINPNWEEGSSLDPNGDNWRDCGLDGYCLGHPNDTNGDENGTEDNGVWDPSENMEENKRYDFDIVNGIGEYFDDEPNGVPGEPAEFCVTGDDGECNLSDPFEDRNCNGKWDDEEIGDKGNGVWDDEENYIDSNGNGEWDNGNGNWSDAEPLYRISDRLETLIVDYSGGFSNRKEVANIDINTAATFYYGTKEDSVHFAYNNFLERISIDAEYAEYYYDIERKETIYTNKIVEDLLPGVAEDYHVTKTKWFQDIGATPWSIYLDNPNYGINYGYDYHLFKIAENGNIIKMVHPAYFYYYGYYYHFADIEYNSWKEIPLHEEVFIYSVDGLLRAGEEYYHDTTIVTPFADYRIQELYEVGFDNSVVVPFEKVTYNLVEGDTVCINEPDAGWLEDPGLEKYIVIELNFMQNCPPVLDTLVETFKITKTKTITMLGTGVEFGLRNTVWLGTEEVAPDKFEPLGIVKDQLEIRWSEPYWEEYGSGWTTLSRLELRSLRKPESLLRSSRIFGIFQPQKRVSLRELGDEEVFDNDPFINTPSYGMHRLGMPNVK